MLYSGRVEKGFIQVFGLTLLQLKPSFPTLGLVVPGHWREGEEARRVRSPEPRTNRRPSSSLGPPRFLPRKPGRQRRKLLHRSDADIRQVQGDEAKLYGRHTVDLSSK